MIHFYRGRILKILSIPHFYPPRLLDLCALYFVVAVLIVHLARAIWTVLLGRHNENYVNL